jgi:hypothetical protein
VHIDSLIWGLEELSDRSLQERLWTGKIEGEVSSFVEAVSSTFDASGLGNLLDLNKSTNQISKDAMEKAAALRRLIQRTPQRGEPMDIIQHPRMDDIRTLAAEILLLVKH